jgi:hypothetical protein
LRADRSARVRGTVVDVAGNALAGVRVGVEGRAESESVVTERNGFFDLPAHAADGQMVRLWAERKGYQREVVTVPAGEFAAQIVIERR